MSRVSWSFNFTAKDEADADSQAASWLKDKLPTLGLAEAQAANVAAQVAFGVGQAKATASMLTLSAGFFVELSGRVLPDASSRNGAGLGVFVSATLPT